MKADPPPPFNRLNRLNLLNRWNRFFGGGNLRGVFLRTSYVSILVSVLLISLISSSLLSRNARKYADTVSRLELSRIRQNADNMVQRLEAFANDFAFNSDIQRLLRQYNQERAPRIIDNIDIINMRIAINYYWRSYAGSLDSAVNNAAVFALNGDMAGSLENFSPALRVSDYDWFETARQSEGRILWLDSVIDPHNRNGKGHTFRMVKKIRDIDPFFIGRDLGYLLVYIDTGLLLDYLAGGYGESGNSVFLAGTGGTVLAHRDPEMIGTPPFSKTYRDNTEVRYHNRRYLYYNAPVRRPAWTIVFLTDLALLMKDANLIRLICLLFSALLLAVFLLFSIHNAQTITRPIRAIQDSFARLETGCFDIAVPGQTGIAELDDLAVHFNRMVRRLENQIYENYESKLREQELISEVKAAEIGALQLQINPHFLYNTLDSINWMALSAGNADISRIILALGRFFRSNMSTSDVFTTLGRDVENVRYFLFIQKARFDDKLDYSLNIDQAVLECKTLRLLLQPLVENSIKHGVDPCDHPCRVEISAYKNGERLYIEVRDNGYGMDGETLNLIRDQWRRIGQITPGECRVGLINIMKRLDLCYQGQAGFVLESGVGQGTMVRVMLPCENYG